MTKAQEYQIWKTALILIQDAYSHLDIDGGPGDCLRDHMDKIWHDMTLEERRDYNAGK